MRRPPLLTVPLAALLSACAGDDAGDAASDTSAATDVETTRATTSGTTTDASASGDPSTTDASASGDPSTSTTDPGTTTTTDPGTTTTTDPGTTTADPTTSTTDPTTGGDGPFVGAIYPLFVAECSCHVAGISGDLTMPDAPTGYANLIDVPSAQLPSMPLVTPGDPNASYLYHKVVGTHADVGGSGMIMPVGGMKLTNAEVTLIEGWIADGAPY